MNWRAGATGRTQRWMSTCPPIAFRTPRIRRPSRVGDGVAGIGDGDAPVPLGRWRLSGANRQWYATSTGASSESDATGGRDAKGRSAALNAEQGARARFGSRRTAHRRAWSGAEEGGVNGASKMSHFFGAGRSRRRTGPGAVLVVAGLLFAVGSAQGYRFFERSEWPRDRRILRAEDALRWSPEIWGAGETSLVGDRSGPGFRVFVRLAGGLPPLPGASPAGLVRVADRRYLVGASRVSEKPRRTGATSGTRSHPTINATACS